MHPLSQFRYCPRCGSGKFVEHNFKSKVCETCGFVYYFNSSASTAAFILNADNELLTVRRAKEPAKGTLDLPGGFVDMYETAEEAIIREVREETGLNVVKPEFLFTLPNIYVYSGFEVHTVDLFFVCHVADFSSLHAADDAAEVLFIPVKEIRTEYFGLDSIRKAVEIWIADLSL
jgi:ADP-ribose pyrophosphatase YjhB (NUDIX family)